MESALLEEIAVLLDKGFVVFVHRQTFEVLSYPDPERWGEMDAIDKYEAIRERLEKEGENFIEIELPSSKESFCIMEDFAQQVSDNRLRERLFDALHSRKPFRYFRQTVEDSTERDAWLAFKSARLQQYVLAILADKWD